MTCGSRVGVCLLLALGCGGLAGCTGPGEKVVPEAQIRTGWDEYRLGNFAQAHDAFQSALRHTPKTNATHLAALYGLATTWNMRRPNEDDVLAEKLYRKLIALAPTNDLAAWSWLALARMKAAPVEGESADLQQQVDAYQDVIDRFPFHSAGEEAFLYQQAARLDEPDEGRARTVLRAMEAFLATHPLSPWRATAYGLCAHCCDVLGLGDKRLQAVFNTWRASEIDPANPVQDRSWTYWQIATVAEFEVGDFATARTYYGKLIEEYPTEQRVFPAKQELKRMDELEARLRQEASKP